MGDDIKRLRPGIPEGRKEYKQHIEVRPKVLVSEYTRRSAHELDHLRGDWLRLSTRQGSLVRRITEESPVFFDGRLVNHVDWLEDNADQISGRHALVGIRIQVLQQFLHDARETCTVFGKRISTSDFLSIRSAVRREMKYLTQLKYELKHALHLKKSVRFSAENWEQMIGEDSLLEALVEAKEAADKFMRQLEASYGKIEMPDYYVSAMAKAKKVIVRKKQELKNEYLIVDGVLTRKSDVD